MVCPCAIYIWCEALSEWTKLWLTRILKKCIDYAIQLVAFPGRSGNQREELKRGLQIQIYDISNLKQYKEITPSRYRECVYSYVYKHHGEDIVVIQIIYQEP